MKYSNNTSNSAMIVNFISHYNMTEHAGFDRGHLSPTCHTCLHMKCVCMYHTMVVQQSQ